MHTDKPDDATALRLMLHEHEKLLEQGLAIVRREQPFVSSLRTALTALTGEPTTLPETDPIRNLFQVPRLAGRAAAPMPLRKTEYAALTIMDSLRVALEKRPPGFVHIDDLVTEVYQPVEDHDLFYRVKRVAVSEIIRGIKKDIFVRGPKPNTFGLRTRPEEKKAG